MAGGAHEWGRDQDRKATCATGDVRRDMTRLVLGDTARREGEAATTEAPAGRQHLSTYRIGIMVCQGIIVWRDHGMAWDHGMRIMVWLGAAISWYGSVLGSRGPGSLPGRRAIAWDVGRTCTGT